jgi:diguanylate cyclase (GGDEF)-like protein
VLLLALAAIGGAVALLAALLLAGWRPRRRSGRTDDGATADLLDGLLDLYSLYETGRVLSAALQLDELLTSALKRVAEIAHVESWALFVLDPEAGTLTSWAAGGFASERLGQATLGAGEGLAGEVCRTRRPAMRAGEAPLPSREAPPPARAAFAVPLIGRDRVLGALILYSRDPAAFDAAERRAHLAAVGRQLGIALDNAVRYARATEMSYQDTLTGLFNRRYLEEALETEVRRAERYALPLSLLMVDIDYFKAYNDAHGHSRGDEVLRIVAQRLREQTRAADIVTRYGGEEFALILPMTAKPRARLVAEKLRAAVADLAIEAPADAPASALTISAGVASYPEDGGTASTLLHAADAALYDAKAHGRNRVEVAAGEKRG